MKFKYNPGSDAAIERGCICPVLDNCHGKGAYNYPGSFYVTQGCKLHTVKLPKEKVKK